MGSHGEREGSDNLSKDTKLLPISRLKNSLFTAFGARDFPAATF
jgi:hypothetical protein